MSLRQCRFVMAGVALLMVGFAGCKSEFDAQHVKVAATITARLDYNGGNCTQTVNGQNTPSIPVHYGDQIKWVTANAVGLYVAFDGNSPFSNSFGNPDGTLGAYSGLAVGAPNTYYVYSSVVINGQPCNNPKGLGIIMR